LPAAERDGASVGALLKKTLFFWAGLSDSSKATGKTIIILFILSYQFYRSHLGILNFK
jgi:hypothetical protein